MRPKKLESLALSRPVFLAEAQQLNNQLLDLSELEVAKLMKIKPELARKVTEMHKNWRSGGVNLTAAVDTFVGDIYSGLQVHDWATEDRAYAQEHLCILSGLYGVLKPNDAISPYRLEMGYSLKFDVYKNLYQFWGDKIAEVLKNEHLVINLSAVEYTKAVLPYLDDAVVVSPRFLTISPKTGEPTFVVVHAKIARGAFASWLIRNRIEKIEDLLGFNELGYKYDKSLSTTEVPVFVCKDFGGIGMSVRLA